MGSHDTPTTHLRSSASDGKFKGQVGLHPSNLDAALYFVRGIARDAEQ